MIADDGKSNWKLFSCLASNTGQFEAVRFSMYGNLGTQLNRPERRINPVLQDVHNTSSRYGLGQRTEAGIVGVIREANALVP